MMRSLFSGVAGLKTHQVKMDVIGNNIANVNTTSFKSQSITFSDLMYQTTQRASRATDTTGGVNARQIGLGAKSGAIGTAITTQGATETTNNPFDMRITGDAFYIVNNGNQTLYTRDGSFYVDGAGNLAMQSTGYFVYGWTAVEDEETGEIKVNTNGGIGKLQIMSAENQTYPPEGTTQAVVSGNIDARDTNITSDNGKTVSLEFYDNLGYLYTAKFAVRDVDDVEHTYTMTLEDILDSSGKTIGAEKLQYVTFSEDPTKSEVQAPTALRTENGDYTKSIVTVKYTATVGSKKSSFKSNTGSGSYSGISTSGFIGDLPDDFLDSVYKNTGDYAPSTTDKPDITTVTYDDSTFYTILEDGSIQTAELVNLDDTDNPYGYTDGLISEYYLNSHSVNNSYISLEFMASDGKSTNVSFQENVKWGNIKDKYGEILKNYYNELQTANIADDDTVKISADGETLIFTHVEVNPTTQRETKTTIKCTTTRKYAIDLTSIKDASSPKIIFKKLGTTTAVSVPTTGLINNGSLTTTQKNVLAEIYEGVNMSGSAVAYEISKNGTTGEYDITIKTIDADTINKTPLGQQYDQKEYNFEVSTTATTATFSNANEGGEVVYDSIPRTGYVSEIADATATADFFKDVYNYDVQKDSDEYELLTYQILDDGKLRISLNNITLTYDSKTGDIVSPKDKIKLDFDQNALIDNQYKMAGFTDVELDFSSTTNYNTSGTSTIGAVKGDLQSLNTGRAVGEMNGISVSKDGTIYATYSNGQTKLLGQIATAEFANASGLEKQGDNLYNSTLNSGEAKVQDVTTDGGYITTGVLEMSNVDLSSEFTSMITTQRGFQANSRIITVSDTLLEELTNLKR